MKIILPLSAIVLLKSQGGGFRQKDALTVHLAFLPLFFRCGPQKHWSVDKLVKDCTLFSFDYPPYMNFILK